MNIMTWASFCWDLAKADLPGIVDQKHYRLRIVGAEDYEETRKMIGRSFALDPNWNSALHEVNAIVENAISRSLSLATTACLAWRHGSRIIAGTFLAVDPNASEQLIPGPCVLMEYRNRGLGTLLLAAAMQHLRGAGLRGACQLTRQASPGCRCL